MSFDILPFSDRRIAPSMAPFGVVARILPARLAGSINALAGQTLWSVIRMLAAVTTVICP
jgi:hypothetical protein